MKIAIIGAGFSGLAACYHLLCRGGCQVTLFDEKGIGGGASGVATGLVHPYPGERVRRRWRATEGLAATRELLQVAEEALGKPVANYEGIVRFVQDEAQRQVFLHHAQLYGDVSFLEGDKFLIHSGITVYSQDYLKGLWEACRAKGAVFYPVRIDRLELLRDYDQIIVAAGIGVLAFPELAHLPVAGVKGQVLTCTLESPLEKSLLGKGHVAVGPDPSYCQIGATYERGFRDEEVNYEKAVEELLPKVATIFPDADKLKILECRAGVRVSRVGHYVPLVGRISDTVWVVSGMGSRGLLYHAYAALVLSEALLLNDEDKIPQELNLSGKNSVFRGNL